MTAEVWAQTASEAGSFLLIVVLVSLWTCVLLRRDKVRRDRMKRGVQS